MERQTEKLLITGGACLNGEVTVSGAKNSVLKLMAACLLTEEACQITNVPNLTDVGVMAEVLQCLGRKVTRQSGALTVEAGAATHLEAPYELVSKMRASFNVLGALLGRYGHARVPLPGGCSIGKRGVDQHVKGLVALGAEVSMDHGYVEAKATRLQGATIVLDMPSVGATENILLASVLAEGSTVLSNAAQEPEIVDLANFLRALGADIEGAGTHEIIINGVSPKALHGISYEVMPDRIEAATYLMAAVGTNGNILVEKARPEHLSAVIAKLEAIGGKVELVGPNQLRASRLNPNQRLQPTPIHTNFYPGFATDLQAPMMVLLTTAEGTSLVTETIYENRYKHVGELRRMGANIEVQGDVAVVTGTERLSGAPVKAHDLRAGAALVIAGLMADSQTSLYNLYHLDRGYEALEAKFNALGAQIIRVPLEDTEHRQLAEVL